MFVLGTSGHVDHGKSTLLKHLTQMEPDRLPEEQKRGMTIDLNFVWFKTENGQPVGIVDVPGHKRFVKNMVSGASLIDAFIFIVAADDGWMPQSEEHLKVLRALGVRQGIAVITKTDLVEEEHIQEVEAEINDKLPGIPILRFSALQPELILPIRQKIEALLRQLPKPRDRNAPRLWIDRVFLPKGLGTVVTGTLREGSLREGDELILLPDGVKVGVKTIQCYQEPAKEARPVTRVALQLTRIDAEKIARGQLLAKHHLPSLTRRWIAKVELQPGMRPKRPVQWAFHVGTLKAAVTASIVDEASSGFWVEMRSDTETPLRSGDRFLLRTMGDERTLGSGVVADPVPSGFPRKKLVELLSNWEDSPKGFVNYVLFKEGLVDRTKAADQSIWSEEEIETILKSLELIVVSAGVFTYKKWIEEATARIRQSLAAGAETSELEIKKGIVKGTDYLLEGKTAAIIFQYLLDTTVIKKEGRGFRLAGAVTLSPAEQERRKRVTQYLKDRGHPVSLREIEETVAAIKHSVWGLVKEGELLSLPEEHFVDREIYESQKAKIAEYLREKGQATTSELKEFLKWSRKNAVLLLEQMDRERITYLKEGLRRLLR